MQPKLTESEGAGLLLEEFVRAGLAIRPGHPLQVGGTVVLLDGYDPERRVGFEFITAEAGDRKSYTKEVLAALEEKVSRGEAFLLLVDEWEVDDAEELRIAARRFLETLRSRRVLP